MPKVALADTFKDWDQLLQAAEPHSDAKELKVHLAELETALHRLRELEARREHLRAQRQQATQELVEVREAGKLVAIQIRSILKGVFGHGSERLVEFNMRPRRRRRKDAPPSPVPDSSPSST
ncbi:MAG TPA: hypothetical protein VGG03_08015 [Thermoanaerobaculia bacterium]